MTERVDSGKYPKPRSGEAVHLMQPKATFRRIIRRSMMANWCSIEAEIVCFDGRGGGNALSEVAHG